MIHSFQNDNAAVMRLATVSGSRKALATVFTSDGGAQEMDQRYSRAVDGIQGRAYMDWFDVDVDIREGDVIHYRDSGRRMRVVAIEKQAGGLGLETDHLQVTMVKFTA